MVGLVVRTLSPQAFIAQWNVAPSAFAVGVFNFKQRIAWEAISVFKKSFYLQRFNSKSQAAWHTKNNYNHPILEETGNLKNSLDFRKTDKGVNIFTNPVFLRTSKRQKGRDFCYAGMHNFGLGNDPQNQFMGHSTVLDDKIREMSRELLHNILL